MKRLLLDTYITNTHSYCPSLISSDKVRSRFVTVADTTKARLAVIKAERGEDGGDEEDGVEIWERNFRLKFWRRGPSLMVGVRDEMKRS